MYKILKLIVGDLQTNCYLLYSDLSKKCVIIDPGDNSEYISSKISDLDLEPVSIIATHGHFDHILAVNDLKLIYKIPFYCHKDDAFLVNSMVKRAQKWLSRKIVEQNPKTEFFLGTEYKNSDFIIKVMHTPGHTPGSVCLYLKKENILFSGDVLFSGGNIGRYDLSYSNRFDLYKSIRLLLKLSNKTVIYSGHGEETNIEKEKEYFKDKS